MENDDFTVDQCNRVGKEMMLRGNSERRNQIAAFCTLDQRTVVRGRQGCRNQVS